MISKTIINTAIEYNIEFDREFCVFFFFLQVILSAEIKMSANKSIRMALIAVRFDYVGK